MRRMDRYKDESPNRINRLEKNQDLYQDLANNTKYTNITDVSNANAFELTKDSGDISSRESYQQMRKYGGMQDVPKVKKELDDFNHIYQKKEKKIYDINSVLEEARKNRDEKDDLEEKRKLKYTSYNILAGINLEELAKYREEKKLSSESSYRLAMAKEKIKEILKVKEVDIVEDSYIDSYFNIYIDTLKDFEDTSYFDSLKISKNPEKIFENGKSMG